MISLAHSYSASQMGIFWFFFYFNSNLVYMEHLVLLMKAIFSTPDLLYICDSVLMNDDEQILQAK